MDGRFLRLAFLASLLAMPLAMAQDEPVEPQHATALYLHHLGYQDMPITTQPPAASYHDDFSLGAATPSLSCIPQLPTVGGPFMDLHTWRGFGFQGHMDYGEAQPRMMFDGGYGPAAPGLDIDLVGDEVVLHWFWSVDAGGTSDAPSSTGIVALPVPGVVVEATLRSGQNISVDGTAFDQGRLLAYGRSEPALLAGPQSTGVTYSRVGDYDVYEFTVAMDIEQPRIPADEGYNLRIDTYVVRDGCPSEGYLTPNVLAVHTSPEHRPRLEVVAEDSPRITSLYGGALPNAPWGRYVVAANVTSPWGNHDVAEVEMTLRSIDDPGFSPYQVLLVEPIPQFHCHCPAAPLQRTWIWDAELDRAPPGRYVATITATSLQGEQTVREVEFTVEAQQEAPGPPVAALLVAICLLAAVLRWRR